MTLPINRTGQRYGRLVAIEPRGSSKHGKVLWLCRCDCGKEAIVLGNSLQSGITTSCGCRLLETSSENGKKNRRVDGGVGYLYDNYRSAAKRRQLSFSITKEQFFALTSADCVYCGHPPSRIAYSRRAKAPYLLNGIDRVDNAIGYEIDNCVPCCTECNRAKHIKSRDDFMAWVARLTDYQNRLRQRETIEQHLDHLGLRISSEFLRNRKDVQ